MRHATLVVVLLTVMASAVMGDDPPSNFIQDPIQPLAVAGSKGDAGSVGSPGSSGRHGSRGRSGRRGLEGPPGEDAQLPHGPATWGATSGEVQQALASGLLVGRELGTDANSDEWQSGTERQETATVGNRIMRWVTVNFVQKPATTPENASESTESTQKESKKMDPIYYILLTLGVVTLIGLVIALVWALTRESAEDMATALAAGCDRTSGSERMRFSGKVGGSRFRASVEPANATPLLQPLPAPGTAMVPVTIAPAHVTLGPVRPATPATPTPTPAVPATTTPTGGTPPPVQPVQPTPAAQPAQPQVRRGGRGRQQPQQPSTAPAAPTPPAATPTPQTTPATAPAATPPAQTPQPAATSTPSPAAPAPAADPPPAQTPPPPVPGGPGAP